MFEREQDANGETIVRLSGLFDGGSARALKPFLCGTSSERIVLDFSRAQGVDYYGLSALVAEIVRGTASVTLRGLCESHFRMLRYFGFEQGRARAVKDAADLS